MASGGGLFLWVFQSGALSRARRAFPPPLGRPVDRCPPRRPRPHGTLRPHLRREPARTSLQLAQLLLPTAAFPNRLVCTSGRSPSGPTEPLPGSLRRPTPQSYPTHPTLPCSGTAEISHFKRFLGRLWWISFLMELSPQGCGLFGCSHGPASSHTTHKRARAQTHAVSRHHPRPLSLTCPTCSARASPRHLCTFIWVMIYSTGAGTKQAPVRRRSKRAVAMRLRGAGPARKEGYLVKDPVKGHCDPRVEDRRGGAVRGAVPPRADVIVVSGRLRWQDGAQGKGPWTLR